MRRIVQGLLAASLMALPISSAQAFCGFYVAKADTKLFNKSSKVVLVRDEDRTVISMANDFQGDVKDFAIVVPVPTFIEKSQIHVTENKYIDHLDAYTAPRLVEYFDENPCRQRYKRSMKSTIPSTAMRAGAAPKRERAKSLGVTIEAEYTVGEYDILILSAKESHGLETWLRESGYRIPNGAHEVLGSYIKQKMRFFVAKVNLQEHDKLGFTTLRPIQVAYESPKFMLPIRLGTVNANGPQDLFVFALTRTGRIETTNYRTVKLPTGMDIPPYVKTEFSDFYRDMFAAQVKKDDMRNVYLEYAWDMSWCDPCAADPLSQQELKQLGVFWLASQGPQPTQGQQQLRRRPMPRPKTGAQNVYVTRLHLRYTAQTFPSDLVFQSTGDRSNFQGRYVLRHPWTGQEQCAEADAYRDRLRTRQEKEAQTLASLTGWDIQKIRGRIGLGQGAGPADRPPSPNPKPAKKKGWWERMWE